MNILALLSVVLAAASVALSITQATLKQFVEVFIVEQEDPLELSCAIAGLAVYETSYDSSCLSAETLAASRVPSESFTAPTTEFKLLFPAQQNFVAEILPINSALAEQLRPIFGDVAADAVIALVEDVETLAFESCAQYMEDAQAALGTIFGVFNNDLLPKLPVVLGAQIVAGVAPILNGIAAALAATDANNPLLAYVVGTFEFVRNATEENCNGGVAIDVATTSLNNGCVAVVYADTGAFITGSGFNFVGGVFATLGGVFGQCNTEIGDSSIITCLLSEINFVAADAGLLAPQGFAGAGDAGFCDVFGGLGCDESSRISFIGFLSALFTNTAQVAAAFGEDAIAAQLGLVAQGFGLELAIFGIFQTEIVAVAPGTTPQILGALNGLNPLFPALFTDDYAPCKLLILAKLGGADLPSIPDFPPTATCSFSVYFTGATELAADTANPLVDILAQITLLYQVCQLSQVNPPDCGLFFPGLFLNGAFGGDLDEDLANFNTIGIDGVFAAGVRECELDEEDLSKISGAQIMMGIAISLYTLCLISTIAAVLSPKGKKIISIVSAILSIIAVALNMGALLLVRSAPVYDAVGEPPELNAAYYQEGVVSTIAIVTVASAAATAISSFGAAFLESRKGKGLEELEVKDEVKDLQVAAKA